MAQLNALAEKARQETGEETALLYKEENPALGVRAIRICLNPSC